MGAAGFFAAFAALTGLSVAAIFIGTAMSERRRTTFLVGTSLIAVFALVPTELQVGTGWIAAALALASALTLAWGWLERLLVWVVGPALVLAALGVRASLSTAVQPMAAASLLVLLIAGSAMMGLALRRVRPRTWFTDLSVLSLLVSLAVMAGPVLSMGWRRAAIAAEGQDPVPTPEPIVLWPLGMVAAAFAAGLVWKLITNARGLK